jgi:hypothetical protein
MSVLADQYKEARQANILTLVSCSKKGTLSDLKNTSETTTPARCKGQFLKNKGSTGSK